MDTTKFTEAHNIQSVGISDDYEENKVDIDVANIKAYDSVTGEDVTAKFDIKVEGGVITATLKAGFTKSLGDAEIHQSSIQLNSPSDVTTSSISQQLLKQTLQVE